MNRTHAFVAVWIPLKIGVVLFSISCLDCWISSFSSTRCSIWWWSWWWSCLLIFKCFNKVFKPIFVFVNHLYRSISRPLTIKCAYATVNPKGLSRACARFLILHHRFAHKNRSIHLLTNDNYRLPSSTQIIQWNESSLIVDKETCYFTVIVLIFECIVNAFYFIAILTVLELIVLFSLAFSSGLLLTQSHSFLQ